MSLFLIWGTLFSVSYAEEGGDANVLPAETEQKQERKFTDNPVSLMKTVYTKANEEGEKVQKTPLDSVNSKYCNELYLDGRFTLARTLCSIKYWIKWYLQYIVYIWLVGATIFIIWNWFMIVTATNKEDQMKKFRTNIINLAIWVILLTSFYFILDVFVSIINFVAEH